MEASRHLPYEDHQLIEISPPPDQAAESAIQQIDVLDAIHQGYQARRVVIDGQDLGIAFTREQVDPIDNDWTYYLHYDPLENGKCFGEIDVHVFGNRFNIYGEAIRTDVGPDSVDRAEKMMMGAMALIPLIIKKDFPRVTNFDDVSELD